MTMKFKVCPRMFMNDASSPARFEFCPAQRLVRVLLGNQRHEGSALMSGLVELRYCLFLAMIGAICGCPSISQTQTSPISTCAEFEEFGATATDEDGSLNTTVCDLAQAALVAWDLDCAIDGARIRDQGDRSLFENTAALGCSPLATIIGNTAGGS